MSVKDKADQLLNNTPEDATLQLYAKVIDNFAKNDEGKERFIGCVAKVLQAVNDYSCFSQVQLEFMDGQKEWFSNTALEEITIDEYNCG